MKIEVTQEDIDRGSRSMTNCCPIALACSRAGMKNVQVATLSLTHSRKVPQEFHLTSKFLPEKAQEFIRAFDLGQEVEPFSFELYDEEETI